MQGDDDADVVDPKHAIPVPRWVLPVKNKSAAPPPRCECSGPTAHPMYQPTRMSPESGGREEAQKKTSNRCHTKLVNRKLSATLQPWPGPERRRSAQHEGGVPVRGTDVREERVLVLRARAWVARLQSPVRWLWTTLEQAFWWKPSSSEIDCPSVSTLCVNDLPTKSWAVPTENTLEGILGWSTMKLSICSIRRWLHSKRKSFVSA